VALSDRYAAQVALLVEVLPFVAEEADFALKGGTAINLFLRDLPRLSVDIQGDADWAAVGLTEAADLPAAAWRRRSISNRARAGSSPTGASIRASMAGWSISSAPRAARTRTSTA